MERRNKTLAFYIHVYHGATSYSYCDIKEVVSSGYVHSRIFYYRVFSAPVATSIKLLIIN